MCVNSTININVKRTVNKLGEYYDEYMRKKKKRRKPKQYFRQEKTKCVKKYYDIVQKAKTIAIESIFVQRVV